MKAAHTEVQPRAPARWMLYRQACVLAILAVFLAGALRAQHDETRPTDERFRVVCWNVLYGFDHGRAVARGATWLAAQRPAVVALQELNGFTPASLGEAARSYGHEHAALQKEAGFALGLTSTAPIEVLERRVDGFHHGYLHCRTHGIEFFVVHFWPGKGHEVEHVEAKARARVEAGAHVVILGDFNTHSPHDAAWHEGKSFEPRYQEVAGVEAAGFVDLVHRFDRLVRYSCPSPITIPQWSKDEAELATKRQRIDFVFADAALAAHARSATIVHTAEVEAVSDHYPVVAEFAWPEPPAARERFAFGVVADCQYCAAKANGVRRYRDSPTKLRACVDHLDGLDLTYVVHLGDFIDRDFESFAVVTPIYASLSCPRHHVLGNHDFVVADEHKARVPKMLGMPARYYDFEVDGWRFVVLDGNDISKQATTAGSPEREAALAYHREHAPDSPLWNGAIGPQQLAWLDDVLTRADEAGERAVLLCHFPVFPEDSHNLWNAAELLELIDCHPSVTAWLNGHNHAGNYGLRNGVHYLTFRGMVDTAETSYAVVETHEAALRVLGFGRERDRLLRLR